MDNKDVICNKPTFNKGTLVRKYNFMEEYFHSISHRFRGNLIHNNTQGEREKLRNKLQIHNFRKKGDEGLIDKRNEFPLIKEFNDNLNNLVTNRLPKLLKKSSLKPIRAKGFEFSQIETSFLYFLFRERGIKHIFGAFREESEASIRYFLNLIFIR